MSPRQSTVVLASDAWGPVPSTDVCTTAAQGWMQRNPDVRTVCCPQSDGGPGLLSAIGAAHPDALSATATVLAPSGASVPASYLRVDGTTYLSAALEPVGRGELGPLGSYGLGQALRLLAERDVGQIVLGLGGSGVIDGGVGLVAALAGWEPGDIDRVRREPNALIAARDALRGVQLIGAYDASTALLGLNGASANAQGSLGLDPTPAQDAEAAMSAWAQHVQRSLPMGRDLLTGLPHRIDRQPGAGAGGGMGFAVAALGGQLRPGSQLVAEATFLNAAVASAEVVVTGCEVFDWQMLTDSAVAQVGAVASALARPAVILAGRVDVGRRELMSLGYAGAYAAATNPRTPMPQQPPEILAAVQQLAFRVAGTWTPSGREVS